jgi:RNA polymerase sigma factor (sigma-70 family)
MGSYFNPSTHSSLIRRVRDRQDNAAWVLFYDTYQPVVMRQVRKEKLDPTDAEDVVQRVFTKLIEKLQVFTYDAKIGRFRDWLWKVIHNEVLDFRKSVRPDVAAGGSDVREILQNVADADREFEIEREEFESSLKAVEERVRLTVGQLRWKTFRAACDGKSAQEIQAETGVPVARVYKYCTEVRDLLKKQVDEILES